MRSYQQRYADDEVCSEGHDKRAGEPCAQCAEEAHPPPVPSIMPIDDFLARQRELKRPVFATCKPHGDDTPTPKSD